LSRPFIPAPNCASVELICSSNGEVVENIFHVQKGSPYSASDLASLRTTVDGYDSATFKQSRSTAVTLQRIRTKALDSTSSPFEDYSLPTPRPGTQAGALWPNNVTWCLKIATGLAGRSQRGRWYMIGLTTGSVGATANQMSSVSGPFFLTWLNGWITTLSAAGHTFVVLSYRTDHAWRGTAHAVPATGFVAVDYNMDSMRKRLTGRGHT
jgi:hypothetical protein